MNNMGNKKVSFYDCMEHFALYIKDYIICIESNRQKTIFYHDMSNYTTRDMVTKVTELRDKIIELQQIIKHWNT